jgi:sulfur dioxygenase
MIFRQLFDPQSSTYSYLLADSATREAVLIDPVFEHARRDAALVEELGLQLRFTLETHVHADHVTGASLLKRRLGSRIALSRDSGAEGGDRYLADGDLIAFGMRTLEARATPGHTQGCIAYVRDDCLMAFTGDALLIRGCGRTDFQGGDARTLYRSIHGKLLSLPGATLIYPGHDYHGRTVTTVDEELRWNPRLGGGRSEAEFVAIMAGLALAHPRFMDVALPRNTRCGSPLAPASEPGDRRPGAPLAR